MNDSTGDTIKVDTARLPLLLRELRLPTIAAMWQTFTERADREGWPAARLLATLAELELAERVQRRVQFHGHAPAYQCGLSSLSDGARRCNHRFRHRICRRTKIAGVTIGMSRKGWRVSKSRSPETMRSARPLRASSRNLSSVGSRHSATRSVMATGSAPREHGARAPDTRAPYVSRCRAAAAPREADVRSPHFSETRHAGRSSGQRLPARMHL